MQCIIKCTNQNPYFGRCYTRDLASGSLLPFPRLSSRLPLRLPFPFTPTAFRSRHRSGPPNNIDVMSPMLLLCAALNDYVVNYQSYNWCASIQLKQWYYYYRQLYRQEPAIHKRLWHEELPYVCQYHCK